MKLKLYEIIIAIYVNVFFVLKRNAFETGLFHWLMNQAQKEAMAKLNNLTKNLYDRIDYLLEGKDLK